MILNATIAPPADSPPDVAAVTPEDSARAIGFMERWVRGHIEIIALAVTAAALVSRIAAANRTYFNPDEILHYLMINQSSLFLAYQASLSNAHPPLIYVLLYFCHLAGRSDLILRLPLVLAGTAFCWFLFKWVQRLFGAPAGLVALILAAFSPIMIALSAEVREYALLLCCMAASLYFLERAFEEKSLRATWCFSLSLYLAILSHYSAVFFVLASGVYVLARFAGSTYPRKMIAAWAIGQLGAFAIYVFLYVTHVSKIKSHVALWAMPFGDTFFQPGQESIFRFTRVNTWNIFLYTFAHRYVAAIILIAFIAALAFLFTRDFLSSPGKHGPRHQGPPHIGIQLLLPFISVWAAAIAGIYPYVGSRHTAFLVPFVLAAAGFAVAAVCRNKFWAALLAASLLAGVSNVYGNPSEPGITSANQSRKVMAGAVAYMHDVVPEGDLILVDQESSLPLAYYYCKPSETNLLNWSGDTFDQFRCQGHPVVTLNFWHLRPESLAATFQKLARNDHLRPGDRVWIFQAGWKGYLLAHLPVELDQFRCVAPKTFGENITIVPLIVGPDLMPAAPQSNCHN